jgi:hypothetical protein
MAGRRPNRPLLWSATARLAGAAAHGPVETVPVPEPKPGETLEVENGILGRTTLLRQARAARQAIEKRRPDRIETPRAV